ncbi:hypothetical protein AXG93_2982s1010 [Marchantia polymorpha subsp. ruderalis]|uniref:Uncharacterized protein n=1 Tax=Marchantia polymorpha subsp. ruderalis TaxID=1480154 RepID=A0A176VYY6_MARPO|nr:hypothetical protein AXG93_2982s1010 [Marchantia polymorpha subsp. ruderalis]
MNPGRFVREVEVDTDLDEVPAITPPGRLRIRYHLLTQEAEIVAPALEQSEAARRVDEELLERLQSQCEELKAQRAAAELQLAEVEGHNRRAADPTREELVAQVGRCLRGYAHWEVATRERVTLRELKMRATALMAGDGRSRRRVTKRLEAFLSRSRDAVANLEAKVECVKLLQVPLGEHRRASREEEQRVRLAWKKTHNRQTNERSIVWNDEALNDECWRILSPDSRNVGTKGCGRRKNANLQKPKESHGNEEGDSKRGVIWPIKEEARRREKEGLFNLAFIVKGGVNWRGCIEDRQEAKDKELYSRVKNRDTKKGQERLRWNLLWKDKC